MRLYTLTFITLSVVVDAGLSSENATHSEEEFGLGYIRGPVRGPAPPRVVPSKGGVPAIGKAKSHPGYNAGYPRFSKIKWAPHEPFNSNFLSHEDYPLQYSAKLGKVQESFCPSVVMPNDYEVKDDIGSMVKLVGHPPHPFNQYGQPDPRYWDEFRFLCKVQLYRRKYEHYPAIHIMPDLPQLWKEFTVKQVADAVFDEYPALHQATYLATYGKTKNPNEASGPFHWKMDKNIVKPRCRTQFLHSIVAMSKFNSYAVDKVAPMNFSAKYFFGKLRPEEMAWKIATGEYNEGHGVPADCAQMVRSMNLGKMQDFTAYRDDGSPQHPSYPAMHSAASSLSVWLPVVAKISHEELLEAIRTDVAVACARTIAGVHYVSDNKAGLKMGQKVLYNQIGNYMAEHYGSDKKAVIAKIKQVEFIWDHYMDKYCNIRLPADFKPLPY